MTDRTKLDAAITEAEETVRESITTSGLGLSYVRAAHKALRKLPALVALRARYDVIDVLPCNVIHYADALLSRGRLTEARIVAAHAGKPDCTCGRCTRLRELDAEARTLLGEDA